MAHPLMQENIWFERNRFQEAEAKYQEHVASQHSGLVVQKSEGPTSNLVSEIARARQNIQSSLSAGVGLSVGVGVENPEILARLSAVEKENADLRKITTDLQAAVVKLTERLSALDTSSKPASSSTPTEAKPVQNGKADDDDDDDDDFDLFGDDDEEEEDEEKKKKTEELVAGYHAKKAKKPAVIAKSNIILDVKPWDDETDLAELEKAVRSVTMDGLVWGASKLVPIAYGIKKLQITCVVEDDKVGTDILEEGITSFDELVQSVDIAAFNKV